ncbi:MAG: DNA primase [Burkholderiales bacterium]
MIPAGFLQDLLSRVDIVDVVGHHVQLKKGGANWMGLCPFHAEKSPSFSVSPSKQFYHCFGCGASGDAIRFLTEHVGLSFVEAVRELAQGVGLQVPEEQVSEDERQRRDTLRQRKLSLADVLVKAADFYRQQLKSRQAASQRAVDYLKKRGLTGEIAARFGLGYAPAGWRTLASVFPQYDDPLLEEAGLVRQREQDEVTASAPQERGRYDWFRDRIMFPIRAVSGEVIGFGGRVLDDSKPKYINSPETPLFSKGRELYGLFESRASLRSRGYALVVEGYMDVVALAQAGLENAVATLGTACTAEHVQKLFRFTDAVVFSFDGDAAGRRAAGRALEASLPHASDTRTVRFLFLPSEHDPDSYVRELGAPAFDTLVQNAVPLSKQLIEQAKDGCDLSAHEGRARFLTQAKPLWNALPDGALKRQLLPDLAAQGGLSVGDLTSLWLAGSPTSSTALESRGSTTASSASVQAYRRPIKRPSVRQAPASPATRALRMLLLNSAWWDMLNADDHELLHQLAAPHGAVFAWFERQIAEHGPQPWAVLEHGLIEHGLQDEASPWVNESALADTMTLNELRQLIDGMWIKRFAEEQVQLIAMAATDPSALQRWRELDVKRKARLVGLANSTEGTG